MANPKSCHPQAATITLLAVFVCSCAQQRPVVPPPLPVPTASQPCPQWTDFPYDLNSNEDSRYLGCTTHVNLRAMLVNPADWDRGRPLGPADGEHAAAAVDAYRHPKEKSVTNQTTVVVPPTTSGGS